MRFSSAPGRAAALLISLVLPFVSLVSAENQIISTALSPCIENSQLSAYFFNVIFTPSQRNLSIDMQANTLISGHIMIGIEVIAYGFDALDEPPTDPCQGGDFESLCPMTAGPLTLIGNVNISASTVSAIPSITYGIPDLDGQVRVKFFRRILEGGTSKPGEILACVQADLSNGKTVYQKGVGWASAVIAGLALVTSAVVSGLGHSNTATHIAANTLSLFGFFQQQALFGMTAVPLPPIVSSWTQNFQWSMGIINTGFIEDIASWYQQATGGTPSTVVASAAHLSIDVMKRSLDWSRSTAASALALATRDYGDTTFFKSLPSSTDLIARTNQNAQNVPSTIVIRGIERVGYRASIELTNIFMTGYIFFVIFVMFVVLGVIAFRWSLEALVKAGKIKSDKFQDFRNGWTTVLRGILFRLILIGFPQMIVLCFWELVHQDSAGEEALAVITVLTMIVMLTWACAKVWLLARRSISMHKNPAYILYSDPVCLHKWGFLYVQFKATAYWFIMPLLAFTFVKCIFIAFGQGSGVAQAVGFLILEAGGLIAISILRPYMDKKTNAFNIAISSVNFASAVFLLFFTGIFGLPGLVVGVMGVVFFILNAVFALVLLLMVLVATIYAIFSKNPDVRYQPMRDDRGSFIKSQSALTTELDALGATARGETKTPFKREFDDDGYSTASDERNGYGSLNVPYSKEGSQRTTFQQHSAHSSMNRGPPSSIGSRSQTASPWQRGAGYE